MSRALLAGILLSAMTASWALGSSSSGVPQETDVMDCNNNGLPDSLDLTWGTLEDVNQNGKADACDPDPEVRSFLYRGWKELAQRPDTSFLGVWYLRDSSIVVRYTVPPGPHRVDFVFVDSESGRTTRLRRKTQPSGAYEFEWIPRGPDGRRRMSGRSEIRATIGPREVRLPIAWRWKVPVR